MVPKRYRLKKSKNNGGPNFNRDTPNNGLISIIAGIIPINVLSKAVVVNAGGTELEFGVAGGEVSTAGDAYKNYNEISTNITTTLTTAKSYALYGVITVSGNAVWTIGGSGTLNII